MTGSSREPHASPGFPGQGLRLARLVCVTSPANPPQSVEAKIDAGRLLFPGGNDGNPVFLSDCSREAVRQPAAPFVANVPE